MNRKIWKALGIAVCMLALAAPRAMAETHRVGSEKQFKDAVEAINKPGDAKNEIVLMQDITLGGNPNEYTLYTLSRGNTTIKGGGNKITISNAGITVTGEGTVLNLGEKGYKGTLTIDGKTSGGFVSVLEGATANMYEHVTLQNWTSAGNACVVIKGSKSVTGSKPVFNMHGGVIEKCSRAVMADSGATFNMSGGEIRNCVSMNDGGGLYADNSTINITGGTIKGNKAAYGGGVALVKSKVKVEEPITNWTVVDNEAYKTDTGSGYIGGGIYLESGSMDVSNGSNKIYNNTADGHGADICLTDDTSSIKLPNAANMGAKYHDSGINIDNWYNDNPRYTPSENGQVVEANKLLNGGLSLVASYTVSPVRIEIDANGGVGGSSSQTVQKGTTVTLEAPTKEGHLFKGWKDEKGNSYPAREDGKVNITATGDMTLTAEWKKLPSAENLPKTGDESPVLLWGAALAVSAAACFMLRRRK